MNPLICGDETAIHPCPFVRKLTKGLKFPDLMIGFLKLLPMLTLTLIQVACFFLRTDFAGNLTFLWNKKIEIWKFFTYALIHDGLDHLIGNLSVQIFVATFQCQIYGPWMPPCVYIFGIVASLLVMSWYPSTEVMGASNGVFALLIVQIITYCANLSKMNHNKVYGVCFGFLTILLLICSEYSVKALSIHFAGMICGLVGAFILLWLQINRSVVDRSTCELVAPEA